MKNVLIAGGSGLLGSKIKDLLVSKGYSVSILSRTKQNIPNVQNYQWDVVNHNVDIEAFQNANYIINLSGEGIADKRWTTNRKKEIIESRTQSTHLIAETLKKYNLKPDAFISASAIGFYGMSYDSKLYEEKDSAGNDFLAEVTEKWEQSTESIETLGIRTVKIRIGVVLSKNGGALAKMALPIKIGMGAPLGKGSQFISWIHIDDLSKVFLKAIEDETMHGPYNAVAPNPVTNTEFMQILAKVMDKKLLLPNIPNFVLNIMLGEMAVVVTKGNNISCKKLNETGFLFKYRVLENALQSLVPFV